MIPVTRLNGRELSLNPELVQWIEEAPDTVITLVTGDKLVVRETLPQVVERILDYRRELPARPLLPVAVPTEETP
ncbi:MAG: flagellar protein FlbD [Planctomycetota bacterium]|nr:MAG: flagellar protein FlbD [Planctomycetota bacterium]